MVAAQFVPEERAVLSIYEVVATGEQMFGLMLSRSLSLVALAPIKDEMADGKFPLVRGLGYYDWSQC